MILRQIHDLIPRNESDEAGIQLLASRTLGSALNRRSAAYLLLDNFLVVAVSEEVCKIVPVRLAAWKHPAFDYRFDAVVYSVNRRMPLAMLFAA